MGLIPVSSENAAELADRYMGTKYDIIKSVADALPWLTSMLADLNQANADYLLMQIGLARSEVILSEITTIYGSMEQIQAVADYVETTQNNIEASIFDMGYNLIRTQAIVATHHTFV
jgi:hypothetical protein